jgi:hypothetical protein
VRLEIGIEAASGQSRQHYSAEISKSFNSPQDEGESTLFNFTDDERLQVYDFLQTLQSHALTAANLSVVGGLLYQKLFSGPLAKCLSNCLLCSRQDGKYTGLAITLHLSDPWLLSLFPCRNSEVRHTYYSSFTRVNCHVPD